MRLITTILIPLCLILGSAQYVFSQGKDLNDITTSGEVKWEPSLSDAYKISDSPKSDTAVIQMPQLNYSIRPVKFNTTFELTPIKAVKIKDENITKLYKNYVKLGFGNYTTPYAEVFVNNLRSKEYSVGAHLKHLSSAGQINDFGPSAFSENLVNIYGERFLPNYAIKANAQYDRNVVHFYGFDPNVYAWKENDVRQKFNHFNTNLEFASHYMDKFKLHHSVKLNYHNLSDIYTAKENDFVIAANANKIYEQYVIAIDADENVIAYKNNLATITRNIVNVLPSVSLKQNEWKVTGGVKLSVESDSASSVYHFYPHADFTYNIIDKLLIFNATFTGGVQKNSFRSFSLENPFINTLYNYKNTNTKIDVSGELKTSLSVNTSFNLGANYKEMGNFGMFVNDALLPNRFNVIYDNAGLFNMHAEFSHQRSERIRFLVKGDYFKYTMENELKAWNKPSFVFLFASHYSLYSLSAIVLRKV